jgi:MarR family transcriptional regulator, organic hydroperoxide resistance regulator
MRDAPGTNAIRSFALASHATYNARMSKRRASTPAPAPARKKADAEVAGPRLGDFLCFAVYSANLAFGRAYKTVLPKLGLTYPQYIALVALWEQDGQTVSGLGEKLFLESNTLTPLLKKLEAAGYVTRRRSAADERQVVVSLTAAGRRLRDKGAGIDLGAATGLSPEEFGRTLRTVARMRDHLLDSAAPDDA